MEIYVARNGDTLAAVAGRHNISAKDLAVANGLHDMQRLCPGLALLLPDNQIQSQRVIELCSCTPSPLLRPSYSLDMSCRITPPATLSFTGPDLKQHSNLLAVSNLTPKGSYSARLVHHALTEPDARKLLLDNIIAASHSGNYIGAHFNFNSLYPFHRDAYSEFLRLAADSLHRKGLLLSVAAAPKEPGSMHEAQDYSALGQLADRIVFLSYDWGHRAGAPQAISPLGRMIPALEKLLMHVPAEKILLGFSDYAYNWILPWKSGDTASIVSNTKAMNLAVSAGSEIRFDNSAKASWFTYTDTLSRRHIVWFEDIRSIVTRLELIDRYSLAGIALCAPAGVSPFTTICINRMFEIK